MRGLLDEMMECELHVGVWDCPIVQHLIIYIVLNTQKSYKLVREPILSGLCTNCRYTN